jgi:hypothetical protein
MTCPPLPTPPNHPNPQPHPSEIKTAILQTVMDHIDGIVRTMAPASRPRDPATPAPLHVAPSEELQRLTALVLALLQQAPGALALDFVRGELLPFIAGLVNWMHDQR